MVVLKKPRSKKYTVAKKPVNDKIEEKIISKNTLLSEYDKIPVCASIRSFNEPQFRCLMRAKNGQKYCAMHLVQKKIIDFKNDYEILDRETNTEACKCRINKIIRKINMTDVKNLKKDSNVVDKNSPAGKNSSTSHEQKTSTIENLYKENEEELEIKLLILVNEYSDKISDLIGPVFQDITLAEDAEDPITYDEFWTIKNGIKTASNVNKYYLFSYYDNNNKIRCFTVFTLYNIIQENKPFHPVTMENIPEKDINRAKELIELYDTKVGLFNSNDSNLSPEFKLKNRLNKLFKQFHIHNIYLEENWLLDVKNEDDLYKIIKETEKLVSNNLKIINPNLHGFSIFQKKKFYKGKKNTSNEILFELKEYIVSEWERLIQAAANPQNQIPIWIIISGLSFIVPAVKEKYPDLEVML